jgi:MFS family permease
MFSDKDLLGLAFRYGGTVLYLLKMLKKQNRFSWLLLSNLSNIFGFALFLPLYGVYIANLGKSPELSSALWAAHTLLTGLLVLIVGRLEDRLQRGYSKALIAGNLLQATGAVLFLLTNNFSLFAMSLLIYSLGTAILAPSWFSLFSASINKKHTAKGWSYSQGFGALSGSLGAACGGYLYHIGGFDYVFIALIVFHALGLSFAVRAVK